MKKMKLDLDQLTVESFSSVDGEKAQQGTVHGRSGSIGTANSDCSGAYCTGMTCQSCEACTYNGENSCSGDHVCFCG
jgi:hypothetical protein